MSEFQGKITEVKFGAQDFHVGPSSVIFADTIVVDELLHSKPIAAVQANICEGCDLNCSGFGKSSEQVYVFRQQSGIPFCNVHLRAVFDREGASEAEIAKIAPCLVSGVGSTTTLTLKR